MPSRYAAEFEDMQYRESQRENFSMGRPTQSHNDYWNERAATEARLARRRKKKLSGRKVIKIHTEAELKAATLRLLKKIDVEDFVYRMFENAWSSYLYTGVARNFTPSQMLAKFSALYEREAKIYNKEYRASAGLNGTIVYNKQQPNAKVPYMVNLISSTRTGYGWQVQRDPSYSYNKVFHNFFDLKKEKHIQNIKTNAGTVKVMATKEQFWKDGYVHSVQYQLRVFSNNKSILELVMENAQAFAEKIYWKLENAGKYQHTDIGKRA